MYLNFEKKRYHGISSFHVNFIFLSNYLIKKIFWVIRQKLIPPKYVNFPEPLKLISCQIYFFLNPPSFFPAKNNEDNVER